MSSATRGVFFMSLNDHAAVGVRLILELLPAIEVELARRAR